MRPHVTIGYACAALFSAFAFAGCTAPVESQDVDEATGVAADAYASFHEPGIYSVRKNTDCKIRLCTGYMITAVNKRIAERHVDSLAFWDAEVEAMALNPDGSIPDGGILVQGYVGAHEGPWDKVPLVVTSAWRGMPYDTAARGDNFFRVNFVEKGRAYLGVELNTKFTAELVHVDVSSAVQAHVDMAWLEDRVLHHGAIVAGHLHEATSTRHVLDVNQVFVRVPEAAPSCAEVAPRCPISAMPAFTRDVDRCLVFDRCIAKDACPVHIGTLPNKCARGYSPQFWTADVESCLDFACDPTFLVR